VTEDGIVSRVSPETRRGVTDVRDDDVLLTKLMASSSDVGLDATPLTQCNGSSECQNDVDNDWLNGGHLLATAANPCRVCDQPPHTCDVNSNVTSPSLTSSVIASGRQHILVLFRFIYDDFNLRELLLIQVM